MIVVELGWMVSGDVVNSPLGGGIQESVGGLAGYSIPQKLGL
jgi:hypothetical protein